MLTPIGKNSDAKIKIKKYEEDLRKKLVRSKDPGDRYNLLRLETCKQLKMRDGDLWYNIKLFSFLNKFLWESKQLVNGTVIFNVQACNDALAQIGDTDIVWNILSKENLNLPKKNEMTFLPAGVDKIKIQPRVDPIPATKPSRKDAVDKMTSSFQNLHLRAPLVKVNYQYGAPQAVKPMKIDYSSAQEIKKSMEREKLESEEKRRAYKLEKQKKSIFFNRQTQTYEGTTKKEYRKAVDFIEKEKELKKHSESDFETKKYLTEQKIEKAVGIKSCCSESEMSVQLYDGIPMEICEKKENLKNYPDSFFNCFVDFFNCIGLSISAKKLRTLVSAAIENYSFSQAELIELFMEVESNIELLGKSMELEKEKMRKLLNGQESMQYKLSNAITEDFVQVGNAIYPFMNRVLENLKRKDFSNKFLFVRDSDNAEVLSDSEFQWLENSTIDDLSFTIGGKMYSKLEFVVIVGYKQSEKNRYGTFETTIRYGLENNRSSESNDRLVLIQSGFLYDLCFVKRDGERVFIMDKTKLFAKTSEKQIEDERLVRKEKKKQLEAVNEKIELLKINFHEKNREIKNLKSQNILLEAAIEKNYNRKYYKETKNCDTLTIVGFMAKVLTGVIQEIKDTATEDDTMEGLEIKFLAKLNEKISKKKSAKYDCRIENINDEYVFITRDTGINTPRVKKQKSSPVNSRPPSPTKDLPENVFDVDFSSFITGILAKINDLWRRNTDSLNMTMNKNNSRIKILEDSMIDIDKKKRKLFQDKDQIVDELSVLKKSLGKKKDQLQQTKASSAENPATPVQQLEEKEKIKARVADVRTPLEITEQYQLEKKHGVAQDLKKLTRYVAPNVYMPGMFGKPVGKK